MVGVVVVVVVVEGGGSRGVRLSSREIGGGGRVRVDLVVRGKVGRRGRRRGSGEWDLRLGRRSQAAGFDGGVLLDGRYRRRGRLGCGW